MRKTFIFFFIFLILISITSAFSSDNGWRIIPNTMSFNNNTLANDLNETSGSLNIINSKVDGAYAGRFWNRNTTFAITPVVPVEIPPECPGNVTAFRVGLSWIEWNWTNSSSSPNYVELWFGEVEGKEWKVNSTEEEYSINYLFDGTNYSLQLIPVDDLGNRNITCLNYTQKTESEVKAMAIGGFSISVIIALIGAAFIAFLIGHSFKNEDQKWYHLTLRAIFYMFSIGFVALSIGALNQLATEAEVTDSTAIQTIITGGVSLIARMQYLFFIIIILLAMLAIIYKVLTMTGQVGKGKDPYNKY